VIVALALALSACTNPYDCGVSGFLDSGIS
jgi:hypothetical protein